MLWKCKVKEQYLIKDRKYACFLTEVYKGVSAEFTKEKYQMPFGKDCWVNPG